MNQDSFLINESKKVYAVADGVGGGEGGEIASQMAVQGIGKISPEEKIDQKITELQAEVLKHALDKYGEAVMGTTLTAIRIVGDQLELGHVGDSRLYLFSQGALRQVTEDHEAFDETHQCPVLASYLGIQTDLYSLTIQTEVLTLSPGDRIILCSDGLYKQVTELQMRDWLIEHNSEPNVLLDKLVKEAEKTEYSDNITLVYLEVAG
jgi:protein phosphatase